MQARTNTGEVVSDGDVPSKSRGFPLPSPRSARQNSAPMLHQTLNFHGKFGWKLGRSAQMEECNKLP